MNESANAVLKELQEIVGVIDVRVDAVAKASRREERARREHDQARASLSAATIKRDQLTEAADLLTANSLNEDWRDWPWVREAGFGAKVPKRGQPGGRTR